ncbi:MAG TPA: hypothetical protein VFC99_05765 [Acidimicrobiia bacterium]|nr:hypothetical protein [Acidimicrobiia bacterium]
MAENEPVETETRPPAEATAAQVETEVAHAVIEATGDPQLAAEVAEEVAEQAEAMEVGQQVEQAVLDATGNDELAESAGMHAQAVTEVAIDEGEAGLHHDEVAPVADPLETVEEVPAAAAEVAAPHVEVVRDQPPRRDHWYWRKLGGR